MPNPAEAPADGSKHVSMRKVKGTIATVTAAIAKSDLPDGEKALLTAKVAALKAEAVMVDCHVFSKNNEWLITAHVIPLF